MTAAQLTGLQLATDPSVVEAARRGDRRAFAALFSQYAPMVHGILLARVHREQADDLVQDVFVAAMERISGLRDPLAFGGWLAAIARHRAVDYFRTRRKTTELPDDLAQSERDRSQAEQVLEVIRTLPEAYRETLVLRLVEGMSGPEIAARVGITAESVRVNLHRGMKLLKEKLGANEP